MKSHHPIGVLTEDRPGPSGRVQTTFPSPYGPLRLLTRNGRICALGWEDAHTGVPRGGHELAPLVERIQAVLEGEELPEPLPLSPGGTPFQRRVWARLLSIPWGEVASYGDVARGVRCPKGSRAVAQACGANPVVLLIPCHRVIAGDGSLGGYGSGLERKAAVLRREGLRVVRRGERWSVERPARRPAPPDQPEQLRPRRASR